MRRTPRTIGLGMLAGLTMAACTGTYTRATIYEYSEITSHDGELYLVRSENTYERGYPISSSASVVRCTPVTGECVQAFNLDTGHSERFNYDGTPAPAPTAPPSIPYDRGTAELEQLCWEDDAGACYAFGLRLEAGQGIATDPERACTMFANACAGGIAEACDKASTCGGW